MMPHVRLFHWKAAEAAPLRKALRAAGYVADYDETWSTEISREIRASLPAAIAIDLTQRPSHGREVAVYLRGLKATRHIPLVFVGGDAAKVDAIRQLLPDAVYTTVKALAAALRGAIAKRPENPVVPAPMMDRYASRTAAQKLGIRENTAAGLIDPPANYAAVIGELPAGARFEESPGGVCPVTLCFLHDEAEVHSSLSSVRSLAGRTKLWIVWRKGGIHGDLVRESGIALGLVDYKICSR